MHSQIEVLRLGHRLPRDERISTHVALVARAFGASSVVYSGQSDKGLEESVERICLNWGSKTPSGPFSISYQKSFLSHIKKRKLEGFCVIHLTMYGMSLPEKLNEIKQSSKILIIVGSEQVPGEVYQLADFNISITNQPHSEVAALAITLDRLVNGNELYGFDFGGKVSISPTTKYRRSF
jgi:tRNA (cytidine56-2'-O)-methyltransferase